MKLLQLARQVKLNKLKEQVPSKPYVEYAINEETNGITAVKLYNFTSVPYCMFAGELEELTSVDFSSSPNLTNIGNSSFGWSNISTLEIPSTVTTIGDSAFTNINATSITFKGTPNSIHSGAFSNNSQLVTLNVPWAEGEVAGSPWGATNATINYAKHKVGTLYYSFSNNVLTISGTGATYDYDGWDQPWESYANSATSIIISNGVTQIGNFAFNAFNKITSIEIPSSATYIKSDVFSGCSQLKTITFKGTPSYLSVWAFEDCDALTTINVPWAPGTVAGENAKWGATNATINYNYTSTT